MSNPMSALLKGRSRTAAERHEARLFRMKVPTRDATPLRMGYEPRFWRLSDGGVADGYGGHISADLWRQRMEELRSPDARHRFVGDSQAIISGDPNWPQRRIECSSCGEVRQVSFFLDPTSLRDNWCTR